MRASAGSGPSIEPRIAVLQRYASEDARWCRQPLPEMVAMSPEEQIVALVRFMARCGRFGADDTNGDNRKRNLAIRAWLDFSMDGLREFGRAWLDKWRERNGSRAWFVDWDRIVESASDVEIEKILLSADEESVRLRSSSPFMTLLPFDVVLQIKRSGVPL